MSVATWSDPYASGAATNGQTSWLGMLMTWLREKSRGSSSVDTPLVAALRRAAAEIGAPLLTATSRGDLDDRLEQAIVQPELQRFDAEAFHLIPLDALTAIAAPTEPPEEMVRVLGAGPAGILIRSGRLHAALVSVIMQFVVENGPESLNSSEFDITAFLMTPRIHSTVKRCVVQGRRSSAALLGIVHALMEGERPAPWLSLALAEISHDGLYEHMRLLASLPLHVPVDLIPLADRFDLLALHHEVEAAESYWEGMADADGELHSCGVPDDDADS